MSPTLLINLPQFKDNLLRIRERLAEVPLRMHFDCSAIDAFEPLIELMARLDMPYFADTRLDNFLIINKYAKDSMLSRPPTLSEVNTVVDLCDISFNSEYETICALSDAALVRQKQHRIILILDLGDLNSGLDLEEAARMIADILGLRGVELVGIACKFKQYGQVIPEQATLCTLADFSSYIQERYQIEFSYINAGDSSTLYLLEEEDFPREINHLIISDAILTGKESAYGGGFAGMHQELITFSAELSELKRKPSLPRGKRSEAEGQHWEDRGLINRVNLAYGSEDIPAEALQPLYKGLTYLGQTMGETIYDVSKLNKNLKLGDTVEFNISLPAIRKAFQSHHINKVLL